ncbi:CbtA family protein [Natrinema longum]|uniref:CbtA family protein n=1 Tax=Natrinema longum TaxID=370324 RepID=A0A8A2UC00_9EURY|nr:CbtA family protein [Natrinema longum]MBZ6495832.1 CbtA family protein [Natrinema longum]QSW86226.1 CbtA family protein [Natrinema longum]
MLVDYLERGVLAGSIAGIAYGAYMTFVANPLIGHMEGLADGGEAEGHAHGAGEHAHAAGGHAHEAGEHAHAVSEATTAAVSIGSGVLWGILLGGIFALAFYFLEPALPGRGRAKTYVLAGAGFLTASVAPWLVLPPTTPGAEQAFDPTLRIAMYAGMMAVGAVVAALSIDGYKRVSKRSRPLGGITAAVPIVALVAVTTVAAPAIVDSGAMPADLVAAFRGLTVLSQAALWALVAGSFGWLQTRAGVRSATDRRDDLLASP